MLNVSVYQSSRTLVNATLTNTTVVYPELHELWLLFSMPIVHRVVAEEQRALGLGFQSVIARLCGGVPGPIVTGYLFDSSCEHWQYQCGEQGHCWVYDNRGLAYLVLGFSLVVLSAASILSVGTWITYPKSGAQGNVVDKKQEEDDASLSSPVTKVNDSEADGKGINVQNKEHPNEGTSLQNGGNHLCGPGKIFMETPV